MKIRWFESVNSKERARREEKVRRRMFPFGEPQREAELRLLRELIATRTRDSDLLYQLFGAKEALCPAGEDEDDPQEALAVWLNSHLTQGYPPAERAVFWALAELEQPMQSLEELPAPDAVRRRAKELMQEHPDLL